MDKFIEIRDVSLKFDNKVLLDHFNLTISKGDKILISGKSGAGKSSLIKMLLGFRNYDSGDIQFIDKTLKSGDFSEIRHIYAYVNQDVTIRKGNIKEFLHILESYKNNAFEFEGNHGLDSKLMDLFEFDSSLVNKSIEELSGGERQRLGLIIAIMLKRPVYLLDEVTSALDKNLKQVVANYFANCKETVISISHDEAWEENGTFKKVVW